MTTADGRRLARLFLVSADPLCAGIWYVCCLSLSRVTLRSSASKSSIRRFVITEKAPTRAFSWLKAATNAFTFKTALVGAFSVITNLRMELFEALILPQVFEPVSRGFPARPRRHRRGPGGLLQHQEVLRVSEGLEDHA